MKTTKVVIANWKMNPVSSDEAKSLYKSIEGAARKLKKTKVVICPPTIHLSLFAGLKKAVRLGAQNMFYEPRGAFTGEVSPLMLRGYNAEYVILGHSERRSRGETNEEVNKKLKAALKSHLVPVVCVGEEVRDDHGEYLKLLEQQIKETLSGISRPALERVIIAYEPVWAIGKSAKDAVSAVILHEMVIFIRKVLSDTFGKAAAVKPPIIYGGSAEQSNAETLMRGGEVAGFLVGHASLVPKEFIAILQIVENV